MQRRLFQCFPPGKGFHSPSPCMHALPLSPSSRLQAVQDFFGAAFQTTLGPGIQLKTLFASTHAFSLKTQASGEGQFAYRCATHCTAHACHTLRFAYMYACVPVFCAGYKSRCHARFRVWGLMRRMHARRLECAGATSASAD